MNLATKAEAVHSYLRGWRDKNGFTGKAGCLYGGGIILIRLLILAPRLKTHCLEASYLTN